MGALVHGLRVVDTCMVLGYHQLVMLDNHVLQLLVFPLYLLDPLNHLLNDTFVFLSPHLFPNCCLLVPLYPLSPCSLVPSELGLELVLQREQARLVLRLVLMPQLILHLRQLRLACTRLLSLGLAPR